MVCPYNNLQIDTEKLRLYKIFEEKISLYGGTTVEYWADCNRYIERELQGFKALMTAKEYEEKKNSKKEDETLEVKVSPPDNPPLKEPKKSRWSIFGGKKEQRPNKA
jgi:glycyl-tRNA synthetase (class II)